MSMDKFDVVIPAGGLIDGEFAAAAGTTIRALAPAGAGRRPVLQVVVAALRESNKVGKIVVVGPEELRSRVEGVDQWLGEPVQEAGQITGGPANILAGLKELDSARTALVCTSDLPFLTADAVAGFVDRIDRAVDIGAGVVSADAYNGRFPDAPPSEYVRLADVGPSTIACIFAVRPGAILGKMELVSSAFEARKSQWGLVRLLGPRLLWEFATKRMSARSICNRLERLLDCRIGLVENAAPETAFDIDTIEDYRYSCKP